MDSIKFVFWVNCFDNWRVPFAQINNQGYTGPGAACAFLSLKILGNFFATSLLQVKETHKLLENFATWASKTEAALTLFVSILRWANKKSITVRLFIIEIKVEIKIDQLWYFHSKFGHRPVPSLWTATKGLTKPSWCWEAQDWHVEMMTKCQTRRELVLTDHPADNPRSHAISGHIEFERHKCLCEFEKRKGFHPHGWQTCRIFGLSFRMDHEISRHGWIIQGLLLAWSWIRWSI